MAVQPRVSKSAIRDIPTRLRCRTMETYPLQRLEVRASRGFTMIEVMVAILVLTVGLVALSSLATATLSGTENARFGGLAANLASEKLEDLNRWPYWDPNV